VTRGGLRALVLACGGLLLLGGCSATRRPTATTPVGELPWLLSADAFATQRLFRGSYSGPEGDGSVRATLRLASAERFQLDVADRLGRAAASLQVAPGSQLAIDHRRRIYCSQPGGLLLPGLGLLPLAAGELPAVLLGALPAAPAEAGTTVAESGELDYRDPRNRRWTATLLAGQPVRWALWDEEGALWWWRAESTAAGKRAGGRLSHRSGRQLRWQEVVVEPLAGAPAGVTPPPAGYGEDCGAFSRSEAVQ
jgi:hypothetical protein